MSVLQMPAGAAETPQQKYTRLQTEVRELAEEVASMEAAPGTELSPLQLAKQVEYLQTQLGDLKLDRVLGHSAATNLADPQAALHKSVCHSIRATYFGAKIFSKDLETRLLSCD